MMRIISSSVAASFMQAPVKFDRLSGIAPRQPAQRRVAGAGRRPMARTISIHVLLTALIGTIAGALVVVFALSAHQAWQEQRTADRVTTITEAITPLFIALQNLRVERGTVNTALATPAAVDPGTRADVAALRAASGPALE